MEGGREQRTPVLCLGERERALAELVLTYRSRGLGTYKLGRLLWPNLQPRTAQKRVQRLLARLERLGLPVGDPERALRVLHASSFDCLKPDEAGDETGVSIYQSESHRDSGEAEDGSVDGGGLRLGRTQRLVIAALRGLGGRARFSVIVAEVASMLGLEGYVSTRSMLAERVWQALYRLYRRGLVHRHRGMYWLDERLGGSGILVENFRVYDWRGRKLQVWSKRSEGRAAALEEALALATLRGATRTIQVELSTVLGGGLARVMDELGITIIKIYRDKHPPYHGRPKLEISFDRPPLRPHLAEHGVWTRVYAMLQELLAKTIKGARIRESGGARMGVLRHGVLSGLSQSWGVGL